MASLKGLLWFSLLHSLARPSTSRLEWNSLTSPSWAGGTVSQHVHGRIWNMEREIFPPNKSHDTAQGTNHIFSMMTRVDRNEGQNEEKQNWS